MRLTSVNPRDKPRLEEEPPGLVSVTAVKPPVYMLTRRIHFAFRRSEIVNILSPSRPFSSQPNLIADIPEENALATLLGIKIDCLAKGCDLGWHLGGPQDPQFVAVDVCPLAPRPRISCGEETDPI